MSVKPESLHDSFPIGTLILKFSKDLGLEALLPKIPIRKIRAGYNELNIR